MIQMSLGGWSVPREGLGAGKGLSLEKRRIRRDLVALHSPWQEGTARGIWDLGAGTEAEELHQGRLRMEIWENSSLERFVQPWHSCPVESLSLEGFKIHVEVALGDMVALAVLGMVGLSELGGLFQPKQFHDSINRDISSPSTALWHIRCSVFSGMWHNAFIWIYLILMLMFNQGM